MPNKKISPDLHRIARLKEELEVINVVEHYHVSKAVLEVAYQIAQLRGDLADLMDEDKKR